MVSLLLRLTYFSRPKARLALEIITRPMGADAPYRLGPTRISILFHRPEGNGASHHSSAIGFLMQYAGMLADKQTARSDLS